MYNLSRLALLCVLLTVKQLVFATLSDFRLIMSNVGEPARIRVCESFPAGDEAKIDFLLGFLPQISIEQLALSSLDEKNALVNELALNMCQGVVGVSTDELGEYIDILNDFTDWRTAWQDQILSNLVYLNVFLITLGISRRELSLISTPQKITLARAKLGWLDLKQTSKAIGGASAPSGGAGGLGLPADVGPLKVEPVLSGFDLHPCPAGGRLPQLGNQRSFCLLSPADLQLNPLQLSRYPLLGKYLGDRGYPMATMAAVIDNSRAGLARANIPGEIRALLPADYQVDFFTELAIWDPAATDPVAIGFAEKDRQINLVFHGTMMSWFADEYAGFNFTTGNVSKNLEMGVFDYDGIAAVTEMGNRNLQSQAVNPHNQHFSPDNARFTVMPDRNLITFWSVAKSAAAHRAIVTYHTLVNGAAYPDFEDLVADAARANNLGDFIAGLPAAVGMGADAAAWQRTIAQLGAWYR